MPNMFKLRPGRPLAENKIKNQTANIEEIKRTEQVAGCCYLAEQDALVFGSNSRTPRNLRPIVTVRARDSWIYVLPGTKLKHNDLFHIARNGCLKTVNSHGLHHDTFFSSMVELIPFHSLEWAICNLTQTVRSNLSQWLRSEFQSGRGQVRQRLTSIT